MKQIENDRVVSEARTWVAPEVKRLEAGAAESQRAGNADGGGNPAQAS